MRPVEDPTGRQDAIARGELRHSTINDQYWQAMFRANYHRWAAFRKQVVAGGDPLDGRPAKVREYDFVARAEGRVVHAAQARFWIARAADLRTKFSSIVLGAAR